MYSLNRATLIGNLTRDPELRYTPSGQAVCSFSVATNRRYKNQTTGEFVDQTEYHDCVAWAKTGEFIAGNLKKGNKMYVEGRLQTRSWDAPDGAKMRRTEIVVDEFVPLTPRPGGANAGASFDSVEDLIGSQPEANDQIDQTVSANSSAPRGRGAKKADSTATPASEEINLDDIPF
ncbi:MAG: single-strand DNA-binding protein [Candidatus Berkelbacteria bacterium Gr01-1014_85]|uniref:Single-stranded DNA-binding protein n=1 Tax=Candidatus Berkelbacteria bacterium Gr01-1014_85 TaxID=2017150 RepID=A0A554JDC2_9BACT|nr:MAG: single-strand DNA-binding protein [Candidatus Berkelbacteria bacterium Gr01-1014_85]